MDDFRPLETQQLSSKGNMKPLRAGRGLIGSAPVSQIKIVSRAQQASVCGICGRPIFVL